MVYVDELRGSRADCTNAHTLLDLRSSHNGLFPALRIMNDSTRGQQRPCVCAVWSGPSSSGFVLFYARLTCICKGTFRQLENQKYLLCLK